MCSFESDSIVFVSTSYIVITIKLTWKIDDDLMME